MLNITNEAWFGDSAAPRQMLAISVFRAAENRVPLVRAANTGISCFIDSYGRMSGRIMRGGKDIFVQGFLTQEIYVADETTFYTRYGDHFALFSAVVAMVLTGTAVLRPSSRKDAGQAVR